MPQHQRGYVSEYSTGAPRALVSAWRAVVTAGQECDFGMYMMPVIRERWPEPSARCEIKSTGCRKKCKEPIVLLHVRR